MVARLVPASAVMPLCLLLGLRPGGLAAEAWPREPGTTFLSLGIEAGADSWRALYVERGVTPRWTLGIDAGQGDGGQVLAFARRAVGALDGPARLSLTLRLGAEIDDGATRALVAPGAAWGRGVPTPLGAGWMEAATRVEIGRETERVKLDLTLGTALADSGRLAMVQWRLDADRDTDRDTDRSTRIAVSYVTPLRDESRAELGVITDPDLSDPALKAALWWEF